MRARMRRRLFALSNAGTLMGAFRQSATRFDSLRGRACCGAASTCHKALLSKGGFTKGTSFYSHRPYSRFGKTFRYIGIFFVKFSQYN